MSNAIANEFSAPTLVTVTTKWTKRPGKWMSFLFVIHGTEVRNRVGHWIGHLRVTDKGEIWIERGFAKGDYNECQIVVGRHI